MAKNKKPDSESTKNNKKVTKSVINFKGKTVIEKAKLLNQAAYDGDLETVLTLLKTKINPNKIVEEHQGLPLTNACRSGYFDIAKALIKAGADVNKKDKRGDRPLKLACNAYKEENIAKIVKILLENGANSDLFKRGEDGPLHYATMYSNFEAVKLLVRHGANVNLSGGYKRTALIYAAANSYPEMLKFLLETKANINANNEAGENALFELITRNNPNSEIAKILIDNGINLHYKNKHYGTALHWAAYCGRKNIIELLLKKGAKINEKNKLNWNALMQACVEGHFTTAKFLLEKGSPTDEIDVEKGATVLTLAKFSKNSKLINFLISKCAKKRIVKIRNKNEAYFSIFNCEICYYLPHKKDLGSSENPEEFKGLETIHTKNSKANRYYNASEMVKKCKNCGTYYHHKHSIDTEDDFISGLWVSQNFQRYNLLKLKSVLQNIENKDEFNEFEKRYNGIIKDLQSELKKSNEIKKNFLPYVIESLTDYYIINNNWVSIKKNLLQHSNPNIALNTINDLVLLFGKNIRRGFFPSYTNYRDFTEIVAKKGKNLLKKHLNEFKNCIEQFKDSKDKKIKIRYKSTIESVKYYKLLNKVV